MNVLSTMKNVAISCGMARPARMFYRNCLKRDQLHRLREDIAFFSRIVGPGDLCFDVGANIGEITEALLKTGAKVVAFEPQDDCLRELKARCGPNPRVTAVNQALGAKIGEESFYVRKSRCISGMLATWDTGIEEVKTVRVSTLDAAISQYGIPKYCKIDVEGYELEVLEGLSQPVPVISFEYHLRDDTLHATYACVERLSRLGDVRINVTPAEKRTYAYKEWKTREEFLLFFKESIPHMDGYFYGDIFVKTTR